MNEKDTVAIKYAKLRLKAREIVMATLVDFTDEKVYLDDITDDAIQAAKSMREGYVGQDIAHKPAWDWEKIWHQGCKRSRRVELAIWVEQKLCGLALGRVSKNCVVATIHYLESNPQSNPLKGNIAPIAIRYVEALGIMHGCTQSSIEQPAPGLVEFYKGLGYLNETTKGQKITRLKKTL